MHLVKAEQTYERETFVDLDTGTVYRYHFKWSGQFPAMYINGTRQMNNNVATRLRAHLDSLAVDLTQDALVTVEADGEPGRCPECERHQSQVERLANLAWDVIVASKHRQGMTTKERLDSVAEKAQAILDQINQENGND